MESIVSFWAVIVAAVVAIVLGMLWYGPLFGKAWLRSVGLDPAVVMNDPQKKKGMGRAMFMNAIASIIMAFVMGHAFVFGSAFTGSTGLAAALGAGFWNWLGFVAPVLLGGVLWEKKSWAWWRILAGYYLVSLILMSIVFALWQ